MNAEQVILHRLWLLAREAWAAGVPAGRFNDLLHHAWPGQEPPSVSPAMPVAPPVATDIRARNAAMTRNFQQFLGGTPDGQEVR